MPAIVTYRFETAKGRPFIDPGPAFRNRRERCYEARYGAVAAFSLDLVRTSRWTLVPQIRCTHRRKADLHSWSAPRSQVRALAAIVF